MESDSDMLRRSLGVAGYGLPPKDPIYRLALLLLLKKFDILDLEKKSVTHMMTMIKTTQPVIPEGAHILPVTGLAIEYIIPCKRRTGNWPPTF